jgi:hypothetical protein
MQTTVSGTENTDTRVSVGGGRSARFVPDTAHDDTLSIPSANSPASDQGWRLEDEDRTGSMSLGGSINLSATVKPQQPVVGSVTLTAVVYVTEGGQTREVTRGQSAQTVVTAGTGPLTFSLILPPPQATTLDSTDTLQVELYLTAGSVGAGIGQPFALVLESSQRPTALTLL